MYVLRGMTPAALSQSKLSSDARSGIHLKSFSIGQLFPWDSCVIFVYLQFFILFGPPIPYNF